MTPNDEPAGNGARAGKVAITGASGQVGSLLRGELAKRSNELVPLNRGEDWGPALKSAEVIVHLAGALVPGRHGSFEEANVETTRAVARGVGEEARRIVFPSYVGAAPDSGNRYLRSKYEAEQILRDTGVEVTVLRCLHIFGPPGTPGPTVSALLAKEGGSRVTVLGSGRQLIQPLYIGDVVDAILAAGLNPRTPAGIFELGGPDTMDMDRFVTTVNQKTIELRHVPKPVAKLLAHLVPTLNPSLVDLLTRDNVVPEENDTAGTFGLRLRGPEDVWGFSPTPDEP